MNPAPPPGPFTAAHAQSLGINRVQLRTMLANGEVSELLHGVYGPPDWPDSQEAKARAASVVLPDHCVIVDRSAASIHGIDVLDYAELDLAPDLEVVSLAGRTRTRRDGIYGGERDLLPDEVMTIGGVRVTSPLRTACDIARLLGRHRAIATLDAFRGAFAITEPQLTRCLPRFRGMRGVTQLRELIPLSATGVDSQPESWLRIDMYDEGFPMPAAQVWVKDVPGWGDAKIENAYEHLRIGVEYDGPENHSTPEDVERDRVRRAALRAAGWIIIVVRRDGFSGAGRQEWVAALRAAFVERDPAYRRRYAKAPGNFRPRRRHRSMRP